jgi:hypothetical protein
MCGPCDEVVHVGLEIFDDAGLVHRRDVGAGVVEGQRTQWRCRAPGELFQQFERLPVSNCEFATCGPSQVPATLWCPLGAMSGCGGKGRTTQ